MIPREHHRARIRLPVRLRWTTPFGQKIELCQTLDVSRGGLLLSVRETHAPGVPLWVTFPYDASLPDGQPEVRARVLRSEDSPRRPDSTAAEKVSVQVFSTKERSGESRRRARAAAIGEAPPAYALAVRFEAPSRADSNGNSVHHQTERRKSPRHLLAVPIRVRPEHVPWFEEAMTLDFSAQGICFRSQREYAVGEPLQIALEDETPAPWAGAKEFRATVVRASPAPGGVALDVCVLRST